MGRRLRSASTTTSTRARRSSATLSVLLTMALRARPRRTTITTTTTSLQLAEALQWGVCKRTALINEKSNKNERKRARPHVHCTEPVRRAKCNDREGNSGVRCLDELHGPVIIGDAISNDMHL